MAVRDIEAGRMYLLYILLKSLLTLGSVYHKHSLTLVDAKHTRTK
jgi:hypothetical protein